MIQQRQQQNGLPIPVGQQPRITLAAKGGEAVGTGQVLLNGQQQKGGGKKLSASGTTESNNRKRSAEPRPHPPHLLNKRYWDSKASGRTRPSITDSDSLPSKEWANGSDQQKQAPHHGHSKKKQPKLEVISNSKRQPEGQHSPCKGIVLNTEAGANRTVVAALGDKIQRQMTPSAAAGGTQGASTILLPFRLPFPPPPPMQMFQPATTGHHHSLPSAPSPQSGFPPLPPPPEFAVPFRFPPPPFFLPPMFHPRHPFIHPPPFPMPPAMNGGQEQPPSAALTAGAVSLFMELLHKQQSVADESTFGVVESATDEILDVGQAPQYRQSTSDEQIDQILDEMMLGHSMAAGRRAPTDRGVHQQKNGDNTGKERLCILPFPIIVPLLLPIPLTTDFVMRHFHS